MCEVVKSNNLILPKESTDYCGKPYLVFMQDGGIVLNGRLATIMNNVDLLKYILLCKDEFMNDSRLETRNYLVALSEHSKLIRVNGSLYYIYTFIKNIRNLTKGKLLGINDEEYDAVVLKYNMLLKVSNSVK